MLINKLLLLMVVEIYNGGFHSDDNKKEWKL